MKSVHSTKRQWGALLRVFSIPLPCFTLQNELIRMSNLIFLTYIWVKFVENKKWRSGNISFQNCLDLRIMQHVLILNPRFKIFLDLYNKPQITDVPGSKLYPISIQIFFSGRAGHTLD